MKKLSIFASGSGTNAENIAKYFSNSKHIEVAVLLSNNPRAGALERMKRLNIPSFTFSKDEFVTGDIVLKKLSEYAVDRIILAGFMNRISPVLIRAYPDRIINIHPALLPKYGGKGMYGMHVHEAVVANHEKESGITIHYINENYDEGRIIFQAKCTVLPEDTPEDVAAKVHRLEYAHYPKVIEKLLTEKT
ncbi:MAG: phosphoribosylglycinamide formyltransferase [Tannerella sp.]|jgi:phosphoribosylglycinamide formyltransferase-1|nr:phosphoribosylglycinamide formyltransferase [Tannerella sp.]